MPLPESNARGGRPNRAGFSLVEIMIALTLLAMVVGVVLTVLIGSQRSKADTESRIEAQQSGRAISDLIAAALRTAGYRSDTDANPDQPAFAYVDSIECIFSSNMNPAPDTNRWVARRKAEVVAAVNGGMLTIEEACERYQLTLEEFASWQRAVDRAGVPGLRVTRTQHYRDLYARQQKY